MLSKEAIFACNDIKVEIVPVPEWSGEVKVRGLSARERDDYEGSLIDARKKGATVNLANMRAKLVALSVVDDAGQRLFSDADIAKLGEKSAASLDRIYGVAQRLSGMSDADQEELAKNLESIPAEGSTSA